MVFEDFFEKSNLVSGFKVVILVVVAAFVWFLLYSLVSLFVDVTAFTTNQAVLWAIGGLVVQVYLLGWLANNYFNL